MSAQPPVPPGSTIGIIGGGQLGRMLAVAAAQLGYRTHVYAPEDDSIAAEVAARFTCAAYDDAEALAAFARQIAVATYEFENIPVGPLASVAGQVPLHPPRRSLEVAQDRLAEKRFVADLGVPVAPFAPVDSAGEMSGALAAVGLPAILKSAREGYDGKGQVRLHDPQDIDGAWEGAGSRRAVLEGYVDFMAEFSILLVRGGDGAVASWDAPQNRHDAGILAHSAVPADGIEHGTIEQARSHALRIAEALNHVGVLACEFFATRDGPLFNEMAPRVHNSGHWTIEGAVTSQFENHIRAVCGLPLGDTRRLAPRVEMDNLIGGQADGWAAILARPGDHLHLYGKGEARDGRKMGHVTRLIGAARPA